VRLTLEFETAQLALMNAERILGNIEIVQGQSEIIYSNVSQGNTLLFGYLIAAYFIGANLTKPQLVILNALYIILSLTSIFGLLAGGMQITEMQVNLELLADLSSVDPVLTEKIVWVAVATQIFMVLASLYFMWTIRKPKIQ
jgi:hypothetical protein